MKNRLILLLSLISIAFVMTVGAGAVHTGIKGTDDAEKLQVIQLLEVMNGDQTGNLNLDADVTRAEFVKMIITASSHKNSVSNSRVSVFPDVKAEHWAASHISVAVSNGYINGYLDGSFKPENKVKLEEAVTVLLKMLGYTSSDFSGVYPDAQLAKYSEIDLDTDVDAVKGQTLTRLDCMKLIYNLLCTKTKNGSAYCLSALGYAVDAVSGTVDLDAVLAEKSTGPYVNTQEALWKTKVSFEDNPNASFYLNGKKKDNYNGEEYDVYYFSEKARTVWFYDRKELGKITGVNPNKKNVQSISLEGFSTPFTLTDDAIDSFTEKGFDVDDYVMLLFDREDKVADVILVDHNIYGKFADSDLSLIEEVNRNLRGPIIVSDNSYSEKIPLNLSEAQIICDGSVISASQIKKSDVLYYSVLANSVWVYRENVSGVYTSVSPSRENPSSVTVGGKTYTLGTDEVKYKFSGFGTFNTDTLVTLVLGKGNEVVDARVADMSVFGDGEDQISYSEAVNATLKGPYVVKQDGKLGEASGIDLATATIRRNSTVISANQIKKNDVYYYSKFFNSVWLFDDTKVGTIDDFNVISPSPYIVLSGNTYSIEGKDVVFELSKLGTVGIGDRVKLLLGKDGNVAGMVSLEEKEESVVYGIVLANGEKEYTDASGKAYVTDTLTVYSTSGETFTYQTSSNIKTGKPVKVIVGENRISATELTSPRSQSYAADVIEAIKNGKFADDVEIIEYYNEQVHSTVPKSKISGKDIWYSYIIHFELDSDGAVKRLILNNFTGDLVEYGLLTSVNRNSATYTYLLDGVETRVVLGDGTYSGNFTVSEGPAYFMFDNSKRNIIKIGNITLKDDITVVSDGIAYTKSGTKYEIAENVRVYTIDSDYKYKAISYDDFKTGEYQTITGYYDKSVSSGGKIRIIIAD